MATKECKHLRRLAIPVPPGFDGHNGTVTELALLVLVVAVLFWRAVNRERRDYARFKRLRSTLARQRVLRRWLVESVAVMGGLSLVTLLGAWHLLGPAADDAIDRLPALAAGRDWLATPLGASVGIAAAALLVAFLVIPLFLVRGSLDEVPALGDIRALLPRTRGELPYGAGLGLSAGVFEELLFRLALPALLFAVVGDGLLAFGLAAVLFGFLHLYQGPTGILLAVVLGVVFTALYLVTGTILVPIALHVLVDLRSLVLIPIALGGVLKPGPHPGPVGA